ncbi:MAG TPA: hypothetical protein VKV74_09970 [Bryobacteraceae bacterium]|nr:hypothetical protein [Bryobacteraceae bacterium]
MSISSLLSSTYLQPLANSAINAVSSAIGAASGATGLGTVSLGSGFRDSSSLSPFTQLLGALQQLQQSNPAQYSQVAGQIAQNLQSAAQTATSDGNTTAANQLNQLAADFTSASQTGQLPNVQDLAAAIGGAHHHHGHHQAASSSTRSDDSNSSDANSSSSSSASSTGSASTPSSQLAQLLGALGANAQNGQFDPQSIIFSTLLNAGVISGN